MRIGTGWLWDQERRRLRSGWRAGLVFVLSPSVLTLLLSAMDRSGRGGEARPFEMTGGLLLGYGVLLGWMGLLSWLALRFLEGMPLASLGYAWHRGWARDVGKGFLVGAGMIVAAVGLQALGGGTRIRWNPRWTDAPGQVAGQIGMALVLFIMAGAFEEVVYRGYAFQTLLRGAPAWVPVGVFSVFFGLMHLQNPNRTAFSTANTVLAGIWLSTAYLRTRSLWFPTALHFTWNWAMGAWFGIPVSGLLVPRQPALLSTSGAPLWLTGGSYGCEGGAATTLVLLAATLWIGRAGWLSVSPEMEAAQRGEASADEAPIRLGLHEDGS